MAYVQTVSARVFPADDWRALISRSADHKLVRDAVADATTWQDGATFHDGSWWPTWERWLGRRSGKQVKARVPGSKKNFPVLAPAPGTYVIDG